MTTDEVVAIEDSATWMRPLISVMIQGIHQLMIRDQFIQSIERVSTWDWHKYKDGAEWLGLSKRVAAVNFRLNSRLEIMDAKLDPDCSIHVIRSGP